MTTWRLMMAAATAAACLAAGCVEARGIEAKPPRPVKIQTVVPAAAPTGIRYSAAIEAFEQVALSFKSAGYVDSLLRRAGADGRLRAAQAGDLVTKGTVLARVRESEYRERVNQARARLMEAQATLEKARLDRERARALFALQSLTKPELDAAEAAFDASQARLAGSQAELELAATALRDTALVSPATGVLLERRIEVGSLVGSGTVGFVVGDISAVKARFGIPDGMIRSVTLGDPIALSVEAVADATFDGRVTAVAPAADPESRVFDVEVTIPNQDGRLRPGMIGTVAVPAAGPGADSASGGVPTVPLTAIVRSTSGPGEYAVFSVENRGAVDVARLRHLRLGDVVGNAIAVAGGLAIGERVVVTGASLLVDGEPVRVIP